MIKFLFSCIIIFLSRFFFPDFLVFWFIGLRLILLLLPFSFTNLITTGQNFLGFNIITDSVSYGLIFLSFWVTLLIFFSRYKILKNNNFSLVFRILVLALIVTLFITFSVNNYLLFYFFFEVSLVPTLLIITGWGYQPERLQAGIYFLFYTLALSLPLLVLIFFFCTTNNSYIIFYKRINLNYGKLTEILFFIFLSGAFFVKLPIFFTHLWLPKAHVEAPVSGSIILAGVLLKLGGYGLFRFLSLGSLGVNFFGGYFIGLRLMGIMYVGFICCRLNDFKALVAYSSVAHIAIVVCGIISFFIWGYTGRFIIIISHGLSSSGLFCIVNIYYERLGRRSFYINKGLITVFPIFTLIIFLLSAANIAAPPTINLLSEIYLMIRILRYEVVIILFFPLGSFLGAVFTLFIFSYSQHGKSYYLNYGYIGINLREVHTLLLHVIPVNFLILNPSFFLVVF
jgi:NADH-ubiquinone oxidoreductase chain 4